MYLNRKDDMYKKMAKSCYPEEYENYKNDKDLAKSLKVSCALKQRHQSSDVC
jgi:hypothetical protein